MKNHFTLLYLMIFVSAFLFSCGEQEEPREDIAWLNLRIENMKQDQEFGKYLNILTGTYEGITVYIFGNCCPNCNSVAPVYDSEENLLGFLSFSEGEGINFNSIQNVKVYWKPKNSACNF
ncbi:hypothetical protein [Belliella aquatica]|nr:hypothetical protein [Belliella aquatica]MCH7407028.1 hypothetical protein [Belliella aquatica]